jgi:large repetitive protein
LVAGPPLVPPFNYRVINSATAAVVQATTAAGATTFDTNPLPSNNQQYIVEVTNGGCTASSAPITVDEDPTVPTNLMANPCTNPITITATGGSAWTWTGPNITGSSTAQTISANPPQGNQTYNVTITQAGFCALDTTITVNVNNDVTAAFTQSDACEDRVTLSATPTGPYTYRWYRNGTLIPGGGGQQIVIGLTDNQASYRVEVVNATTGCVFSSPASTANVAGDLRVTLMATTPCTGSPFTLTAVPNPPSINTFQWTRNGTVIPGQSSAVLTETRAGSYIVTVSQSGCTVTDDMNIVLLPVTPGLLQDTGIICPDPANPDVETREILLDPGPDFLTYTWFDGITTQTYRATQAGTYSVDLVNTFGCASSDQIILKEECDPFITGPNAFRPTSNVNEGGEYTNREFRLFTFFIADTDFQIFIFNRWGEMIYQSNERLFRWNGGYNNNPGQPLPPGTYSYLVKYKSSYRPQDGTKEKRGGVVLLR